MLRAIREGYVVRFNLPEECGYTGYSVKCIYKYKKKKEKYSLQMRLVHEDFDDEFKIDSQEIDTQYIPGTRESIESNIARIVEYAALSGFFDEYVKKFEYTYKCFDKGNDFFEKERLNADHEN